jgi:hypothetical protein
MHREKNLFHRVFAFDNLHRAFLGASHGKRDQPEVRDFEYHLETRLWEIRRELEAGAYAWGAFRRFWVNDPKRREIRAAPFRDRVVHHGTTSATWTTSSCWHRIAAKRATDCVQFGPS